jgi:homoserine dehydrogenase
MEPIGVALIGCGTVGSGVAKLLLEQGPRLAERAGRPLALRRVVVRDPAKARRVAVPDNLIVTDVREVIRDRSIAIAVELIGGIEPARQIILDCLEAGKDVVTANKAVLAKHGSELFDAARVHERALAFEASVAGGIPIISALTQGLAANQILSIKAILNGTSNFILTQMTEQGESYADALREAQRLGYAEADPTLDVDGSDAAHKLAILCRIAFSANVPFDVIQRRGIDSLQLSDVRYAHELGYIVKLLAEAWMQEGQVAIHVEPTLLRKHDPLAQVRGAYNAIHVVGDAVGDALFYGRGAGQMPTASAVTSDLIDLAVGRAQHTFRAWKPWTHAKSLNLRRPESILSRFYLRIIVQDQPGVIGEVASILGRCRISIASVIQHEPIEGTEGSVVPVVIMTHPANLLHVRQALTQIDQLKCVSGPSVYYPVAE